MNAARSLRLFHRPMVSRLAAPQIAPVSRFRAMSSTTPKSGDGAIRHISQLDGTGLYFLSKIEGTAQVDACRERLRREIMFIDGVDYDGATPKLLEMNKVNSAGLWQKKLPYQATFWTAQVSGWASLPLVFYVGLAKPFNQICVTTEVPEPEDLQTMLEVGMWTWNWMEPPLGTVSFFLLCMQFAREASNNMGAKTPVMRHKEYLAASLQQAFPMYNGDIVADYAKATAFDDDDDDIKLDYLKQKDAHRAPCINDGNVTGK